MPRQSAKSVKLDTTVRCDRVYPTGEKAKSIDDLKTVGVKLNKDQAIQLARVLLAVTQEWDEIDLTAHRTKNRITVTSWADKREEET